MFHNPQIYTLTRLRDGEILYGGNCHEIVELFLISIENFKQQHNITDTLALEDLEYVLYGPALAWWKQNRKSFKNWQQAINSLRKEFCRNS